MKELTIEQKAKAYDEAIERARYWEKNPTVWSSDDICQKLFPELKEIEESEDERIRKNIISYLKSSTAISPKTWIAWLEKQGEQKSQGKSALEAAKEEKVDNQNCVKPVDKVEPIIVRDFNSVFSREQVEEIDRRIEESQRLYNAKMRDAMLKVKDFPMTD